MALDVQLGGAAARGAAEGLQLAGLGGSDAALPIEVEPLLQEQPLGPPGSRLVHVALHVDHDPVAARAGLDRSEIQRADHDPLHPLDLLGLHALAQLGGQPGPEDPLRAPPARLLVADVEQVGELREHEAGEPGVLVAQPSRRVAPGLSGDVGGEHDAAPALPEAGLALVVVPDHVDDGDDDRYRDADLRVPDDQPDDQVDGDAVAATPAAAPAAAVALAPAHPGEGLHADQQDGGHRGADQEGCEQSSSGHGAIR